MIIVTLPGLWTLAVSFLNLPSMVNTLTYSYLSDGTKLSVKKSDGSSIVYRGSFVYDVSARNVVTLESVGIPEGRVYCSDTPDERNWECWDIKDYLGNVRAVVRSDNGSPIEISDYLPYGTRLEEYNPPYQVGNNRWHYAGKELQDFGGYDEANLIDFGARYYSPGIGRWTTLDPKAWNYTSTSPYNYCNNNPVNFVDPDGESIYKLLPDGTIQVVELNDEKYDILEIENGEVYLKDQTILNQLSSVGEAGLRKASSNSREIIRLFYILSDYSNVEWALHIDENEGGPIFYIGSIGKNDTAGSYDLYMNSNPDVSMHSHPSVLPNIEDELWSMGILINKDGTAQKFINYDWDNVSNGKTAHLYYVYFPNSGRRYLLNKKGYNYKIVGR